jgi:Tol biopolymer transport system component
MGEVYRARDSRLGRDVAVKVLPPAVADSPTVLARFEREAQAVAALSHPNILTLHDVGKAASTSSGQAVTYAVMELLEGETLRARLADGALPQRKALDIAAQIARGLAAAHDKHIAHRDLKPENVFITADGSVKILDFGLARNTAVSPAPAADSATVAPGTEPGMVLGTVGYMAPEQVRGEGGDQRSDVFALGCVLYEMLIGRRAYQRDTPAETMTAILKEDPPEPSASGVILSPGIQRIVRRCLEKRPEERFQSTRDLAFALESALDASSSGSGTSAMPAMATAARRWSAGVPLLAAGLLIGAAVAGFALHGRQQAAATAAAAPTYTRLTFERGTIRDARFTPDGQSVIYSAAWEGNPLRIFMTRTDAPESVRLGLPDARLLSISRSGEMAISLGHVYEGWMGFGTLARSSVLGSAPRVLLDDVREAEWSPDGSELAVIRHADALEQIEFPIGKTLYTTSGYISDLRFSPSGDALAFSDHPIFGDDAGAVSMMDRAGKRRVLADGYNSVRGLAWAPGGNEVWFSATRGGSSGGAEGLYAVTRTGALRVVMTGPSRSTLFDIGSDGRVLIGHETPDRRVEVLMPGANAPVDVSVRAASISQWISDDGTAFTISDQSTPKYTAYLVKKGGAAIALGDGQAYGVSSDGRWVLSLPVDGSQVLLHPTGAGQTRALPNPQHVLVQIAAWLPDSRHIVMFGQPQGQPLRGYVQDIDGGDPRAFTPANIGANLLRWWTLPVSPDGSRVVARNRDGVPAIYRISDGQTQPVPGVAADDVPVQWSADGAALYVARGAGVPWVIDRADLATGRRTHLVDIRARDAAGLRLSMLSITPDGKCYVHSFSRLLTDLFVVDGLR